MNIDKEKILNDLIKNENNRTRDKLIKELEKYDIEYTLDKGEYENTKKEIEIIEKRMDEKLEQVLNNMRKNNFDMNRKLDGVIEKVSIINKWLGIVLLSYVVVIIFILLVLLQIVSK